MNEWMSFPEVWAPPHDDVSGPFAPEPVLRVLAHCDPLPEHTVFVSVPSLGDDECPPSHLSACSTTALFPIPTTKPYGPSRMMSVLGGYALREVEERDVC